MKTIIFFDLEINDISFEELISQIELSINQNEKVIITYANANTLNLVYNDRKNVSLFSNFDIIHPDGIGIFLASKIIYKKNALKNKITGSDFYPVLINNAIDKNWEVFIFGNEDSTLEKISDTFPDLNVSGFSEGYNYNTENLIKDINNKKVNILVVGLGTPKQEKWIVENKDKLNCNVIIAVGDGIKVFAGNKIRGPKFARKLGLEWFFRLANNPAKYWRRYLIGIFLFIFRILKLKFNLNKL